MVFLKKALKPVGLVLSLSGEIDIWFSIFASERTFRIWINFVQSVALWLFCHLFEVGEETVCILDESGPVSTNSNSRKSHRVHFFWSVAVIDTHQDFEAELYNVTFDLSFRKWQNDDAASTVSSLGYELFIVSVHRFKCCYIPKPSGFCIIDFFFFFFKRTVTYVIKWSVTVY